MNKINPKRTFLKPMPIAIMILLVAVLALALDLTVEFSSFKNLVKIVKSAFDINPAPQPGSNLRVCTGSVTWGDMCVAPLQPVLSWSVTSGTQTAYAVQVDNNGWLPKTPSSAFPSPEVDTGEVASVSNSYAVPAGKFSFNTTYFWQIAIKDNFGSWSGWTEADASFTTTKHAWPSVNFSWVPLYPSVKETVQFADQSTVYGGATKSAWLWTIPDANYIGGTNSSSQNPKVKFQSESAKQVTLRVIDSDGFACQASKTVNVQIPLPGWKEVAP